MDKRLSAHESDGPDAIRLRAIRMAQDGTNWGVPVPLEVTERARRTIRPGRGPGNPLGGLG
jgi:hypothetical protein